MKKWLDNYGKQANYNDSKATASPDMVGDGYSNVGRNYSPAWRGQFQKGGKLKFLQPTSDKLPEGYRIPYDTPSTERASSIGGTNGEPAYLVPEFKYGQPIYDSIEEFKRTGEHLGGPFKTWQEAEEWENIVRHPAVENRETIMFPQEKFQTGGSIPGSVGFTYARTKGIPSNGPYAKKTLASAQNGVDMYDNPIIAKENYIKGAGRSNYKPRTNISNLYDLDPRYNHTRAHENYHARQFAEGRSNFDIGHNTENALWAEMQKRPEITSTEEVFDSFHNRKQKEMEMDRPDMVNIVPETRFMPSKLIDKYIDRNGLQYRNPNSMEGEAEYYGDLGEEYYKIPKGQNGMEMKYYQNGLDFKPKSISRDGAWLDQYDVAQNGKKKFKLKDERLQAIRPSESTFVKKPNFETEQAKVQRTYVDQVGKQMAEEKRRKKLTKEQREREDYNARNKQTGSIQTPVEESTWDRTKAIVSNPLTAFGYAARNESLPARFQHGERNTLDNAIDWINPLQGAAALSEIPGELGRGEFLNAGLSALDAADLGIYARGAMKASKPLLQKAGQQLGNVKTSIAPELRQGLRAAGPSFGSSIENTGNISKNLEDLTHAKDWAKQYGYELPENLERIAQSDELTNRTVRGMMNRHNTFVRGVSTNWDELAQRNPEILRHLEGKGFDLSTKEGTKQAAEYMATHVPIQTGYGRASLNQEVFERGQDAIYTSNSIPTAEGYTYGQGYITKVKKPTDFSSSNRQDWITQNNPEYYKNALPSERAFTVQELESAVDYKNLDNFLKEGRIDRNQYDKLSKYYNDSQNIKTELYKKYNIDNLPKSISDYTPEQDKLFDAYIEELNAAKKNIRNEVFNKQYNNKILRTERKNLDDATFADNWQQIYNKFPEAKEKFREFIKEHNLTDKILNSSEADPWFRKFAAENNYLSNDNPYAHYLHIGTPGEKILEPIKSWEITPDIWKNKSRAHTNTYTKKLSALEKGGIIKDDRGQWEHPGEITEIGSNNITMQGVPYPVLGISDTGDTKLMKPGKDYKFKGKKVTEFPMAKNGRRQEQKGLQNLEDLTNFTNYNKPSNWLNKYN